MPGWSNARVLRDRGGAVQQENKFGPKRFCYRRAGNACGAAACVPLAGREFFSRDNALSCDLAVWPYTES
ncbi:hypothetical protein PUN4_1030058 [Paraburkholderia unamae]|nr:hypothetical protein PUN4_1030058 [Paraburkholderia unamae]